MTDFLGTTQGIMTLGALVGAGSFALGAASSSLGRLTKRLLRHGRSRADRRNLAMMSVLAFDDFVGTCHAAVHDTPVFNPMDHGEFVFHAPEPLLALPKDVDWALLGSELGEEVMWFSNRVRTLEHALDSLDLSAPNYDGFFERRQEGYTRLAVSAMDIIARLLTEFDLTMPDKPDYYRQTEGFAAILRKIEAGNNRTAANGGSGQAAGTNVTQLFPR